MINIALLSLFEAVCALSQVLFSLVQEPPSSKSYIDISRHYALGKSEFVIPMRFLSLSVFLMSVTLAGCGGGGSSSVSTPGNPSPGTPESPQPGTPEPENPEPDVSISALNDTGQTLCGDYAIGGSGIDNNDVDCALSGSNEVENGLDPVPQGQDATYGRDADPALNDDIDGYAGFSFTKLDAVSGGELAANANDWGCVKDNVTGLIWEVKTSEGGLRDGGFRYSWYNSSGVNDGGEPGLADAGDACFDSDRCDTEKYIADINSSGLCGYSDGWRLPTPNELFSIVDISRFGPAIDERFFPNTRRRDGQYWTSKSYADPATRAYTVFSDSGAFSEILKEASVFVRLVRDAQ